jgi:hypothetical protein
MSVQRALPVTGASRTAHNMAGYLVLLVVRIFQSRSLSFVFDKR